jgi:outer membrane receptor protein involved in Fe transport
MKKIVLALSLMFASLQADAIGNIGLGYSKGDNSGNMITAFGSLNVIAGAALRLEYTKNIDEHAEFSKEDVSRYGLFATYELALLPGLSVTPKVGLVKTDGEFEFIDSVKKVTDSDTKFTYGLELDYYFNDQFSAFLGYTDYGDKLHGIDDVSLDAMDQSNYTLGLKLHL